MASDKEEQIRPVLDAIKNLGPEGELAANEIEEIINKLAPKSGATFTGATRYMKVDLEPDGQPDCFGLYVFDNDGTLELRVRNPQGEDVVLHTET